MYEFKLVKNIEKATKEQFELDSNAETKNHHHYFSVLFSRHVNVSNARSMGAQVAESSKL